MGRNQAGKNFAAREKKRCQKRLEDEIVASLAVTSDEATGVAAPQGPALTLQGVLGAFKNIQDANKALQDKVEALKSQLKDSNRKMNVIERREKKRYKEIRKAIVMCKGLKRDMEAGLSAFYNLVKFCGSRLEKENAKLRGVVNYLVKQPPHNGAYFDEDWGMWRKWEERTGTATQTQQPDTAEGSGTAADDHAAGGDIVITVRELRSRSRH